MQNVVSIQLPVGDLPSGFVARSMSHHQTRYSPAQARALKRLTVALDGAHARLANGTPVVKPYQALQWLLEQYDGAVES